jgi:hypothetical protein
MRKIATLAIATIAILFLTVLGSLPGTWAASPHYKKGPSCVDNGLTATCTGTIAGLGNGNVIATLDFPNATGTTTCTNPGGNQAPGQNPATPAATSGSAFIPKVKNGTVSFTVITDPPTNPTPQAAGCPNGQWTAAFNNITFGNGTLTITQDDGTGNFVPVLTTNVSLF